MVQGKTTPTPPSSGFLKEANLLGGLDLSSLQVRALLNLIVRQSYRFANVLMILPGNE